MSTTHKFYNEYNYRNLWRPVYDDPSAGTAGQSSGEPTPKNVETSTGGDGKEGEKMFNQEQLEHELGKRLAKEKTRQDELLGELKTVKNLQGLTTDERDSLQERITSIEKANMSKEELAIRDRKEAEVKYQEELKTSKDQAGVWKSRFEESTITRALTDAAAKEKAFNTSQVVTLLQHNTTLVETTVDGKKTGAFEPRVKFVGRDSDNNALEMDLTVPQAVAEMKKMSSEYGNLFESGLNGGLGGSNAGGGNGKLTDSVLGSQEAYDKNRERIKGTL